MLTHDCYYHPSETIQEPFTTQQNDPLPIFKKGKIFDRLNPSHLRSCALVSRAWHQATKELLKGLEAKYDNIIFGVKHWEILGLDFEKEEIEEPSVLFKVLKFLDLVPKCFDTPVEPNQPFMPKPFLPKGTFDWLEKPRFGGRLPSKLEKTTGMFLLMPKGINLFKLEKIFKHTFDIELHSYLEDGHDFKSHFFHRSVGEHYWFWIDTAILVDRTTNHLAPKDRVEIYKGNGRSMQNYPRLTEITLTVLAHYILTGNYLLTENDNYNPKRWKFFPYISCDADIVEKQLTFDPNLTFRPYIGCFSSERLVLMASIKPDRKSDKPERREINFSGGGY